MFPSLTVTTEIDDDVFTVCTIQHTTKFVISGVRDPLTGDVISLDEALSRGIVNQQKGVYW